MDHTAIVFGATGLVGKELVFELLGDDKFLKVIAVVRHSLPLSHSKLEQIVIAGYQDLDNLKSRLAANVYFCCIGTTIKKAGTQDAFRKVDLDLPVKIAGIAQSLQVPHMIVISSLGANANSSNFYLRTKGEMEQQVQGTYKGNLKIVRPSLLLGHRAEFRLGERAVQVISLVIGLFLIGPLARYKGIWSWDVARAMIRSMELPNDKIVLESDELHRLADSRKNQTPKDHEVIR